MVFYVDGRAGHDPLVNMMQPNFYNIYARELTVPHCGEAGRPVNIGDEPMRSLMNNSHAHTFDSLYSAHFRYRKPYNNGAARTQCMHKRP